MAKQNWAVDVSHSSLEFSVKHMMIATVRGSFHEFTASVEADPQDLTSANIRFDVGVGSVDSRNADRDAHLKSADFFDVEKYPTLSFVSTSVKKTGDDEYDVTGDLTIRDVTKPVTFAVVFEGEGQDPWGNQRVGFSGSAKINRRDFGLSWNVPLEKGGVLVGETVNIRIEIEAIPAS